MDCTKLRGGGKLLPYISGRQILFKWIVAGTGVQEFRSSGVQEFRSSGVQEFRSSGVQEFRSSGVQEFRSQPGKSGLKSSYYLEAIFLTNSVRLLQILQLLNSCNS